MLTFAYKNSKPMYSFLKKLYFTLKVLALESYSLQPQKIFLKLALMPIELNAVYFRKCSHFISYKLSRLLAIFKKTHFTRIVAKVLNFICDLRNFLQNYF